MQLKDLRNARMTAIQELGQFYGIRSSTGADGMTFAADLMGAATVAPKGRVYYLPHSATYVGIFDTKKYTPSYSTIPYTGDRVRITAVLAPNGKIYSAPYVNTHLTCTVIDTATNTITYPTFDLGLTTPLDKWANGVYHPNGKIYFTTVDNVTLMLVIDTLTDTAEITNLKMPTQLFSDTTFYKMIAIGVASNGNLVCSSTVGTYFIDVDTGLYSRDVHLSDIKGAGTIVNDIVYELPYSTGTMVSVTDDTARTSVNFTGGFGTNSAIQCSVGGDGHIYNSPWLAKPGRFNPIRFNVELESVRTWTTTSPMTRGAACGASGQVYMAPKSNGLHIRMIPAGGSKLPEHLRLGFKKLLTA